MLKSKNVKVVYITYVTQRKRNQKQYAFISEMDENIAIDGYNEPIIDKNMHNALIEVIIFSSEAKAIESARKYCAPECIYISRNRQWSLAS